MKNVKWRIIDQTRSFSTSDLYWSDRFWVAESLWDGWFVSDQGDWFWTVPVAGYDTIGRSTLEWNW